MSRSHSTFGEFAESEINKIAPSRISIVAVYGAVLVPILVVLASLFLILAHSFNGQLPTPSGCSKLGLHEKSNLDDEHDEKYSRGEEESGDGRWRVKSLWIYPIKSCQGVELGSNKVVATGMKYDRQFCFAQLLSPFPVSSSDSKSKQAAHKWRFITQREFPLLSQVKTEVWLPDPTRPGYSEDLPDVRTDGVVVVRFPFQEDGWRGILANLLAKFHGGVPERSFKIPFNPTQEQVKRDFTMDQFTIWKDAPQSLNMGLLLPPELKYSLGVGNPLTLFRVANEREVFRSAPRKDQLGWQPVTGFADAYPLNIVGLASVQAVSRKQPQGSPRLVVRRFRPNIVVAGSPPFSEDEWKKVRIGKHEYHVVCRCVRCKVPNVDPSTGERHKEQPYRTLITQRQIDKGAPGLGCLGMNMVPFLEEGEIQVGDVVTVLETGVHTYIK